MDHELLRRRPHHELQLLPSLGSQRQSESGQIPLYSPAASPHVPPASLDLQLSITTSAAASSPNGGRKYKAEAEQAAAEQIRLAAVEKAYAERVRELARKEMELAQNELARASHVWERAREEVGRAERLKARWVVPNVDEEDIMMQITCHCCGQRFVRPAS